MTSTQLQTAADTFTQQIDIPRFASGVTAVYGLSGAGKSTLADTACVYVAERFSLGTMCVALDPGGWGNRRMSLIRQGIMQIYDPRNHVDFFDTMDKLSRGAWPEKILDPERGYADPHVRLIFPRQQVFAVKCPQGHDVAKFYDEALMLTSQTACPTCGVVVNVSNQVTEQLTIKPALFKRVGLRIFDSITAMNDQGLILELPRMSAAGDLPVSRTGGSALGSADAVRQGDFVVGTSSEAQVGFMQNRSYGWLVNIRTIPDQIIGAICTFGVEESKEDPRGGEVAYGPAIAGRARTSRVPGWVGNCLHATKEPDGDGHIRHRLWLSNHIDARDFSKRPYLAKHRGTPLGMPEFLEDPWSEDPHTRAMTAGTVCSLKYFFELLEQQYAVVAADDQQRFAGFKAAVAADTAAGDEILQAAVPVTPAAPIASVSIGTGGRSLARPALRRAGGVPVAPPAAAAAIAGVPVTPAAVPVPVNDNGAAAPAEQPSVIQRQLEAALAALAAQQTTQQTDIVASTAVAYSAPQSAAPPPPPIATGPPAPGRLRRAARPPTQ